MTDLPEKVEARDRINLVGLSSRELAGQVESFGMKPFRWKQVFQWIYKHRAHTFGEMTNLSRKDRKLLDERAQISSPAVSERLVAPDGTEKFLYRMEDGHQVEGVLIPDERRVTLCVSTQVGCRMGCAFCLTGRGGWVRDLTAAEIVGQVLRAWENLPPERSLTHLVFMGMGEPLANYEETVRAIRILLDPAGFDFSNRKITVSTCGLVPAIRKLGAEGLGINLAVSLNAPGNDTRNRIMPINRRYSLEDLLQALRKFPLPGRRRITFEYVLLHGVNDSREDAGRLSKLLRGIPCKINLIPYNPIHGSDLIPPTREEIEEFQKILVRNHYTAILRESRGREISAACGQLKERQEHSSS